METYTRVARVYSLAAVGGEPPVAAVAAHFGVPHRTASHWVKKTREAGFLAEHVAVTNLKLKAVADAVGIDYNTLRAAIIEHAGGDLRIGNKA